MFTVILLVSDVCSASVVTTCKPITICCACLLMHDQTVDYMRVKNRGIPTKVNPDCC